MQMQCKNGIKIRIASHRTTTEKKIAYSHFFASHSHRTTIPAMDPARSTSQTTIIITSHQQLRYLLAEHHKALQTTQSGHISTRKCGF